jgi:hypothetical protein
MWDPRQEVLEPHFLMRKSKGELAVQKLYCPVSLPILRFQWISMVD